MRGKSIDEQYTLDVVSGIFWVAECQSVQYDNQDRKMRLITLFQHI